MINIKISSGCLHVDLVCLTQTHGCNCGEFEYIKPAAHWWTCCVYVASWVEKIKLLVCGHGDRTFNNICHLWQMIQTSDTCVTNERYVSKFSCTLRILSIQFAPNNKWAGRMLTAVRGALFHIFVRALYEGRAGTKFACQCQRHL